MEKRKLYAALGIVLIVAGIVFLFMTKTSVTGAAAGINEFYGGTRSFIAMLLLFSGLLVLLASPAAKEEKRDIESMTEAEFKEFIKRSGSHEKDRIKEEVYSKLMDKIDEKAKAHPSNKKYIDGLKEIKSKIEDDSKVYDAGTFAWLKDKALKRGFRWLKAIEERENDFFDVPFHSLENVLDTPDSSKFAYRPLIHRRAHKTPEGETRFVYDQKATQKRSKYVVLEVVHYTNDDALKGIANAYHNQKEDIFLAGKGIGWTFFTAKPIPEGYGNISTVREVLGLHAEEYAPGYERKPLEHQQSRDPQRYIRFRIKVPKERVFIEDTYQKAPDGTDVLITKYAITGQIRFKDIVGRPVAGRYGVKKLLEQDPEKKGPLKEKPL